MSESNPQAVYRAEHTGTVLVSCALYVWFAVLSTRWLPPFNVFVGALVGFPVFVFILSRFADYRALLRCQRAGILVYVRTREVVNKKPSLESSDDEYSCRIGLFSAASPFGYLGGFVAMALVYYWNSLPTFVPLIPDFAVRFAIVATIAAPIYWHFSKVQWRVFQLSSRGIAQSFLTVSWNSVASCVIIRDFGSARATPEVPVLTASFYSAQGLWLTSVRLSPLMEPKVEAYEHLENTIYAYMGGRDPLSEPVELPGS